MRYFSMFSGIGGFELGIQKAYPEAECVGFSEIDKYAVKVYLSHFPDHKNYGDATRIVPEELPDFDLLCGGFPCQAFSIAGKRGGLEDTRGTLFYHIARIARAKRPKLLFLENVKGLLSHDKGRTFGLILSTFSDLGYVLEWQVLNSKDHGVPQNRERVFIIGHRNDSRQKPIFPLEYDKKEIGYEILREEKVLVLSEDISKDIGLLLEVLQQEKKSELSKESMQDLLIQIKQGIQKGKCREVSGDTTEMDSIPKGLLQIVEELNSWSQGQNHARKVYGVVSIPTEEVLLLWASRGESKISFRRLQQQGISFDRGQNRLIESISNGKSGSLLFAMQPYQGRLFYSIGNGRDWTKIYTAEVETKCTPTLSSILEESVDERYFLSESQTKKIMSQAFDQTKRITDTGGVSPTVSTPSGGHHLPKIIDCKNSFGKPKVYQNESPTLTGNHYKEPLKVIRDNQNR